nr:cohesin domain-containing protein [Paenibacillus aceris]
MSGTDAASLAADARLGYKINFPATGNYNVWLLAKSVDYNSDSIHVGIDNQYKFTANGIEGVSGGQFKWVNLSTLGGTALNIAAGVHELNLWGREDGLIIDRIYLTTSSSTSDPVWPPSTPAGAVLQGPAKANRGETFDLNYGLSGKDQNNIYGQDLTFTYDPSQLEYVSAESVKPNDVVIVDQTQKQGEVRFLVATIGQSAHLDGSLLKLHWKVKSGTQAAASTISLSKGVIANETGHESNLESRSYTVQVSVIDKTALISLISEAQGKHDAATEGTGAGQYPAGSKAVLKAAIDQAKAVADNTAATQEQVEKTVSELTTALQTFMNSVITIQPGDANGDGRYSVGDLGIIAAAYGKTSADPNWSSFKNFDLNNDGKIGIEDLAALARKILE